MSNIYKDLTYEDLGRRVVQCKHWRWLEGMSGFSPSKHEGDTGYIFRITDEADEVSEGEYPNLNDPATMGCLLYLVQEVWGIGVYLFPDGGWHVKGARLENGSSINLGICERSEAAALVAALENAPQ